MKLRIGALGSCSNVCVRDSESHATANHMTNIQRISSEYPARTSVS